LLTARKRVGPIPARRLLWRHVSHHLSNRHSSPDSSSSSSPSDHSSSGHTPPDTTDADKATPLRFGHRSLARTPRQSSLGSSFERSLDSSLLSFGPYRKRCRSPTASVPSPTHVSRSIAPTPADLLPPRKRFRDSYSSKDSKEEHMRVDTANAYDVIDVEASAVDTRDIAVDPLAIGDSSESSKGGILDLEDTIHDIVHYMSKVHIDRITEIETTQRQLETSQLVAREERASLVERIRSLRLEYLKEEFRQVCRDRDDTRRRLMRTMTITCSANALEAENQSQNGSDDDNGNGGNGNSMEFELWNLTVKNNDLAAYAQRFQELTMMCTNMVPEEED
nr:hypothetical protein [Tanacetum cinerariifolium]